MTQGFATTWVRRGLLVLALTVAGCSSSSSGGSTDAAPGVPTDPTAFGAHYRFGNGEIVGWSQTTDPNDPFPYGVFTDGNLDQRIDGGNMLYISHGMTIAMYQNLVGPNDATNTVVAMYFGTDAKAATMFGDQKTATAAATAIGDYDASAAIGNSLITGITAYAHFGAVYVEVQLDGIGDQTAAAQTAAQFVKALESKTK